MESAIEKLLQFQAHDAARHQLETFLQSVTADMERIQQKLLAENEHWKAEKKAISDLEAQRLEVESRLKNQESQIIKYKTQQLETKKREEYTALTEAINRLAEEINVLETQGIQLLLEIDNQRDLLQEKEKTHQQKIEAIKQEQARVQENAQKWALEKKQEDEVLAQLMPLLDPIFTKAYETTKSRIKKPPFVVPIEDHRCMGCYLRVSNDTLKNARDGNVPHNCDNCGRMVFLSEKNV